MRRLGRDFAPPLWHDPVQFAGVLTSVRLGATDAVVETPSDRAKEFSLCPIS
jgi:hypothetical protein